MTDSSHRSNKPDGWHAITPRIASGDPEGLIRFLRDVFSATGEYRSGSPSIITIDDSMLMIGDADIRGVVPAFLYVYVDDVDSAYDLAMKLGARSFETPFDTPYGDRRGMFEDPWGNIWQVATHLKSRDRLT